MVYLAGVISTDAEGVITGTVGLDRTIDEGYAAARACALTQLAVLRSAIWVARRSEKHRQRERLCECRSPGSPIRPR